MPKVSIVIPVYNVEEYLRTCLDSVVNQTLEDIEIICINDGSTDNSLSILEEFAKKDNRIKLISKPNSGYGHTMNLGIKESQGEYIGIVEPDDYVSLEMYETLYKSALKHDVDFIKADFCRFEGEGETIKFSYNHLSTDDSYYNRLIDPQNDTKPFNFTMNTWSGIYKRNFIEKHKICHNESPGASFQDNGFWFQTFSLATKIYFLNKPFYLKRKDNPNSSVMSKEKVFVVCDEYEFIRKFLDNNPIIRENTGLKNELIAIYQSKRFNNYLFSLRRIDEKFRKVFLKRFHEDYVLAENSQELNKHFFSEKNWYFLQLIINDSDRFYKEYFNIPSIFKKTKLNSLLNFLYVVKKSKGNLKRIYNFLKAFRMIKKLNLFDEEQYIKKNYRLNLSSISPLNHYIFHGFKENKMPSDEFDGNYYLKVNEDVRKTKQNPLVHYVLYGKKEGRSPNRFSTSKTTDNDL
ncbi:MAG: glycosyltransferase [Methanobrevibacter sp.]|nr:glycosyltransferase [Methanobrevibacter sp.]